MMNVQELSDKVGERLRNRFGDAILTSEIHYDFPVYIIQREIVEDLLLYLYNDTELSFRFMTTLCGLHYPDQKDRELGVMYQLHNMGENWRIRLKTFFPIHDPTVATATSGYWKRKV